MTEHEIEMAKAYLAATGRDPIAALIRSVKDLARARRALVERDLTLPARAMRPGRPALTAPDTRRL